MGFGRHGGSVKGVGAGRRVLGWTPVQLRGCGGKSSQGWTQTAPGDERASGEVRPPVTRGWRDADGDLGADRRAGPALLDDWPRGRSLAAAVYAAARLCVSLTSQDPPSPHVGSGGRFGVRRPPRSQDRQCGGIGAQPGGPGCPWLQSVSPGGLPHKNSDAERTTKAGQQSQQEGGNRGSRAGSWGSDAPQLGMLLRWACPQPEPQSMTLAPHQRPLEAPPLPDARGAARPRLWCWAPCSPASSRWPRH